MSNKSTNQPRLSAKYEQIRIKSKNSIQFLLKIKKFLSLIKVKSANFVPAGGIFNTKGDIYVEMIIDGTPSRKTEIVHKTWSPEWNETFDM
jgi:hypothetical protein